MENITINVSETTSKIIIDKSTKFDIKIIDEICSFSIPNAQFSNKFKEGKWDGKYHLFNKEKMTFPTGLLTNIMEILKIYRLNYKINIKYKEKLKINKINCQLKNVKLRNYQINGIESAIKNGRGIIQMPTASGKTILACGLIAKLNYKTLFIVHTKDLLYQTYNMFNEHLKNVDIGIVGDGNVKNGDIIVATVQTLASKLKNNNEYFGDIESDINLKYGDEKPLIVKLNPTNISSDMVKNIIKSCNLLIFDECHHIPAQTFYKVAMFSKTPYRFGLSATPTRDDGFEMKIQAGLGNIIYKISISELIKLGYLVKPTIKFLPLPQKDYAKNSNFQHVYNDYIINNEIRNQIISLISKEAEQNNKQTLILVKRKRHMNLIKDLIPNAKTIYGNLKSEDRNQLINDFKIGKIKTIIATTLADEGIDLPSIECLIIGGGGKYKVQTIQRIGRALRLYDTCPICKSTNINIFKINSICKCKDCKTKWKYKGKKEVVIYDFVDNTKSWLFNHYLERRKCYEEEEEFSILMRDIKYESK